MSEIDLPKIKLGKFDKVWLKTLYQKIKNNEPTSYRGIRAELFKKLPLNFHPNNIDSRLVNNNGEDLTLLGVYAIDPSNDVIKKANKILNAAREHLMADTQTDSIKTSDLEQTTKIPAKEIGFILKLISKYGQFWRSASYYNDSYGYSSISISNDNNVFDQYLYFSSVEELINKYYEIQNNNEIQDPEEIKEEPHIQNIPVFNPIFASRISQIDLKLCFILMPFTEEWSDRIYRKYLRENIESLGLQCLRADNLTGQIVIEDIWTKINQAAFIIADVTGRNPNVMYELGIAHTVGKPVILITQEIGNIPFDFKHLRHYNYKDDADGRDEFCIQLKSIIANIYNENYSSSNILA